MDTLLQTAVLLCRGLCPGRAGLGRRRSKLDKGRVCAQTGDDGCHCDRGLAHHARPARRTAGAVFLPGLVFSLAGDVFLMLPGARFFRLGLMSFLVAQVCYIIGLNPSLPPLPALIPLSIIAALGLLVVRGIASGLRRSGQIALLGPWRSIAACSA